jgi:hypothetical protein
LLRPVQVGDGENVSSPDKKSGSAQLLEIKESKVTAEIKPQLKVGGNVSIEGSAKRTSAVIPNAIRSIEGVIQQIGEEVQQAIDCSTGMTTDCAYY